MSDNIKANIILHFFILLNLAVSCLGIYVIFPCFAKIAFSLILFFIPLSLIIITLIISYKENKQ